MPEFNEKDIVKNFDAQTLRRGRYAHAKGLVLEADLNSNGSVVVGRVRGSAPAPYKQMIAIRSGRSGVLFHGTCSCKVRTNCKHVAAVLLQVAQQTAQQSAVDGQTDAADDPNAATSADGLSHTLKFWLDDLNQAIASPETGNDYPPETKHRLIYVLEVTPGRGGAAPRIHIVPTVGRLNKDGNFGATVSTYTIGNIFNSTHPKYLRPIDHDILREMDALIRHTKQNAHSKLRLSSHMQIAPLLEKVLKTERCHWGNIHGPQLRYGALEKADLRWICEDETSGRQRLEMVPTENSDGDTSQSDTDLGDRAAYDAVLATSPPFYVRTEPGIAGPIDIGLPHRIAAKLAEAPEVPPLEAAQLSAVLDKRFAAAQIKDRVPLPQAPQDVAMRDTQPIPRLELYEGDVRLQQPYSWYVEDQNYRGVFKLPLARLAFDYDGEIVPFDDKSEVLQRLDKGVLTVTARHMATEVEALEKLAKFGLKRMHDCPLVPAGDSDTTPFYFVPDSAHNPYEFVEQFDNPHLFIAFSSDVVPELVADGWQIAYAEGYPYQIAEGKTGWWADVDEGSGIDWFSFELGIEFEGERINLAPQLATMLARLPDDLKDLLTSDNPDDIELLSEALKLHHRLPDGRLLPLPAGRLIPVLRALMELIGPRADKLEDGAVNLHRAEAAALAEAAGALGQDVAWTASAERLIKLGEDLRRGRTLKDVTPPISFKAELRPYQQTGLSWLDFLRETGFGGVLADDMGLGKTVQTLAFLAREKAEGRLEKPALIIAPTSVMPNWQAEAERFASDLKVLPLRGVGRKQSFGEIPNHDLVLTTYPLLARDATVLLEHNFHAAILDEAQAIKNPKANVSKIAHAIKADHRLALTGTPLENNLGEVWSLFQFLSPGLLGDETTFRRTFRTPIEKHGCQTAQSFLTRRLKPFMLRRTKQEVATELPPKTEITERIRLEGAQRDLYETVRVLMHSKVREQIAKKGLAKSHIVFLDALLKLRQICCDPRLLKMTQARKVKTSAKLERLMQMLPDMVAEGRRILVFSQFTSMLSLIEKELAERDISYVTLTGKTEDRGLPVKAFQEGDVPVFLLSLKAGGTGLNLTAADTVIHYDPWWNPAVEAQATDRAYRIGQTKNVFVYKMVVEEGIEEAIELLKARKAALADALFEGASKSGLDLTEADISALFAPLEAEPRRRAA